MAIAFVGQAGIGGASLTSPQTVTYSSTAGNTLVVTGHFFNSSSGSDFPVSVTDTAGNIWQVSTGNAQNPPTQQQSSGASVETNFIAWCVGAAAVTSVTVARQDTGSNWWRLAVSEWSGVVRFDNSWAGTAASSTTFTMGPVNLSTSGELVIGVADGPVGSGSLTIPTSWTTFTSQGANDSGYYLAGSTTGSYSPVWTTSVADLWAGTLAVFSPAGLPALNASPGRTWGRRFRHPQSTGSPPPPNVTVTAGLATGTGAAAGAAPPVPSAGNFVPGRAVPGQAVPGRPYINGLTIQALTPAIPAPLAFAAGRAWRRLFKHPQLLAPPGSAVPVTNAPAQLATGTGAALQAQVAAGANAALATGTGAALAPVAATGANAQLATGTGAAQQPAPAVGANAGLATGTGAALAPGASSGANAGLATGTGAAQQPIVAITVLAGLATGTGAALPPTVQTSGSTNAPAQLATGTGAALAPGASAGANAGLATGTGAAKAAVLAVQANAQAAAASAAALNVPPQFTVGQLTATSTAASATLSASSARQGTLSASTSP